MPKGPKGQRRPADVIGAAVHVMRQHMRRFTRLTAAHSKKLANHIHMVALYTVWYNYARISLAVKMAQRWPLAYQRRFGIWPTLCGWQMNLKR